MDAVSLRKSLVSELRRAGALATPSVVRAMLAVPRHLFVPGVPIEEAYRDRAIMTKSINGLPVSSISQPAIVAIMLDQLGVQPGMNVLEIGAGTGYNAALLAELAGPEGRVTTIDIDADIVEAARVHLQSAGYECVQVMLGDGGNGVPSNAPFDRTILTVAAWDVSPAWLEQLAPGGLLVLPLWLGVRQFSIAFEKTDGCLESRSVRSCGFMPLRGAFAGPALFAVADGVQFSGPTVARFSPTIVRNLFDAPPRRHTLTIPTPMTDLIDFMALRDQIVCVVFQADERAVVRSAYTVIADEGRSAAMMPFASASRWHPDAEVDVYGSDAAWQLLAEQAERFEASNCPSLWHATIHVCRAGQSTTGSAGLVLQKPWMDYRIRYP